MNRLVGYFRKMGDGNIKLSINVEAFKDCEIYRVSDGKEYVSLSLHSNGANKVLNGTQAVSTIYEEVE